MALEVANEIKAQLGNRALFMLGAKMLSGDANSLSFKIACRKGNHLKIALDPSDTYTVQLYKIRGMDCKLVAEQAMVYCDQLHKTIEAMTGLYTSL